MSTHGGTIGRGRIKKERCRAYVQALRQKAVKDKERKLAAPKHAAATRIQSAGRRRHASARTAR